MTQEALRTGRSIALAGNHTACERARRRIRACRVEQVEQPVKGHLKNTALAALILALASLGSAEAGPINLAWDPSTDLDIAGYVVSYGTSPGLYTSTINVGNVVSYAFSPPDPTVRYYLAVRAVDTTGLISPYSNEIVTTPALKLTGLSANRTSPQPVGTSITFLRDGQRWDHAVSIQVVGQQRHNLDRRSAMVGEQHVRFDAGSAKFQLHGHRVGAERVEYGRRA